jgi:hypothetical protein
MEAEEVHARYQEARRKTLRSINFWFGLAALAGLVATTTVFGWLLAQGLFVLQAVALIGGCALAFAVARCGDTFAASACTMCSNPFALD